MSNELASAHVTAMPLQRRKHIELQQLGGSKLVDGFSSCMRPTKATTRT